MRRKSITGDPKDYITTLQAKGILCGKEIPADIQRYSLRGSRKTYYRKDDIDGLAEAEKSTVVYFSDDKNDIKNNLVVIAYVDGSFNADTGIYGSAAILTVDGEILSTKTSQGTEMSAMRNVAGEISAAKMAVIMAEELIPNELIIRYDYEGIEKWPTGEWRAKNDYTLEYSSFMCRKRPFPIKYEHIKAHSGDKFNEMADDMAVKACGVVTMEEKIPAFTGERNTIHEQMRRIKYQVCSSCMKGIEDFYRKDKHAFKDYAGLRCHVSDNLSQMYNSCDFMEVLTNDEMMYISSCLMEKNDILNAMRWTVRGLMVEDAVRKALTDKELFGKRRG